MTYHCNRCGTNNEIVNQCGCDPENMPTRPTHCRACRIEIEEPDRLQEWDGYCWGCYKDACSRALAAAGIKTVPIDAPLRGPTQTFAEAFIESARNGELTEEMALEWLDDEEVGKALDEIATCRSNPQASK